MAFDAVPDAVTRLVNVYISRLRLPADTLWLTVDRKVFEEWLGRRVFSAIGGAYVFLVRQRKHAVLINLDRIDLDKPRSLEIVVAEELIHMRDWIDGDRRRHSHHGHDRIAWRVAELTGAPIEDVRAPLRPVKRRPWRYIYACPACGLQVPRRRKGRWGCPRCSVRFDPRFELRIAECLEPDSTEPG